MRLTLCVISAAVNPAARRSFRTLRGGARIAGLELGQEVHMREDSRTKAISRRHETVDVLHDRELEEYGSNLLVCRPCDSVGPGG